MPSTYEQNIMVDVAAGRRIVVEGITQSLTKYVFSDRELSGFSFPASRCKDLPEDGTILGYRAVRRTSGQAASNSRVIDSWYAPDQGNALPRSMRQARLKF